MIYLVYPGLGKTYATKLDSRILDVRLSSFKNLNVMKIDPEASENLKGTSIKLDQNPAFPGNLISFLTNAINENKIPLLALKTENVEFVVVNNFDFIFIMPAPDKVEQLAKQYKTRGNNDFVIQRNINNIDKVLQSIKEYNKPIYYVHKDEHFYDVLNRIEQITKNHNNYTD